MEELEQVCKEILQIGISFSAAIWYNILEEDSRYTPAQIAAMTGKNEEYVRETVKRCEEEHIINGYTALVDWDRTSEEAVTAFIEVKITPQRDDGYDRRPRRI